MATVGSLVVNLQGNSKSLTNALDRGRSSLVAFAGIASGALAGLGASVGLGALVKSSLDTIDTQSKAAAKLGITTEAMVGMNHAAELAGVSTGDLDSSVAKMLNNLSDAAVKGGPVADTLKRLGLSARDLVNKSPDAAFGAIADKIGAIKNPAERTATAMDIFGKSGQNLFALFEGGSAGLASAAADAKLLGLSFSAVDGKQVEAANDAISRMKSLFVGFGNTLAIAIAPHIKTISDGMVDFGVRARAAIDELVPKFVQWGKAGVQAADDLAFAWRNFGALAELSVVNLGIAVLEMFPQIEGPLQWYGTTMISIWAGAIAGVQSFGKSALAVFNGLRDVADAFANGLAAVWDSVASGDFSGAAGKFGEAFSKTLADSKRDLEGGGNPATAFADAFTKTQKDAAKLFGKSGGISGLLKDRRDDLISGIADIEAKHSAAAMVTAAEAATSVATPGTGQGAFGGTTETKATGDNKGLARDSAEAFSAILANRRGTKDPQAKIADLTKQQLAETKGIRAALEKGTPPALALGKI